MFRRRPGPGAQQVAPKGGPQGGGVRRRPPQLPKLPTPELPVGGGARVPRGCSSWWQELDSEPRLPALATAEPRAARSRAGLRSLLLPPLLSAGSARGPAPRLAGLREGEAPDSLGALLGEMLPGKFREFLQQLYRKCAESPEPEPQTPSAPRQRRGGWEHCRAPQRSSCPVLPDLWGQSSHFQDRLKKILFHQLPVLGHLRGDSSQFATVKQANQLHGTAASEARPVLSPCSSREGLGSRRRCCPFRVRFADETLRDSALRYWERCCAAVQPDARTAALPAVSERVLGSVGRWLESLPKPLHPRAKETAKACWDQPSLRTDELQASPSRHAPLNSSLPSIPRTTAQSRWGGLKAPLDTSHRLQQLGESPCFWSHKLDSFLPSLVLQSVLKRSCPKDFQLLPPRALQRAQR